MIKDGGGDRTLIVIEGIDVCVVFDKGNGIHYCNQQPKMVPTPPKGSLKKEVILPIDNDWEMGIEMGLIGVEAWMVGAFIHLYKACFAFKLTDLEEYKGKPVRI